MVERASFPAAAGVADFVASLLINVLNPQFLESPGEPLKRANIQVKNSFRSIYFETLRRAKKTGC